MITCKKCKTELPDEAKYCYICGKATTAKKPVRKSRNKAGYIRERNGKYDACYPLATERIGTKLKRPIITKTGFNTMTEARDYLPTLKKQREEMEEAARNNTAAPNTFEYYVNVYFASSMYTEICAQKKQQYGYAAKAIIEQLGNVVITKLTPSVTELEKFCRKKPNGEERTYYPAKDIKTVLGHIYELAHRDNEIIPNKVGEIDIKNLKGKDEKEVKAFTADDVKKFWKAYDDGNEIAPYILIMCYTGMMPAELLKLKKENIYLDVQQIIGAGAKTKIRKEEPILLCNDILPVIKKIYDETPDDELIFPYSKNTLDRRLKKLEEAYGCSLYTSYSCRHTTATLLKRGGVDGLTIKQIMRQTDIKMTAKYIDPDNNIPLKVMNSAFEKQIKKPQDMEEKTPKND